MEHSSAIEFKLDKLKLIKSLIVPILFMGLGLKIIIVHPQGHIPVLDNHIFILIVGIANILFSGLIIFFNFKRVVQTSPCIVISEEGITDNYSWAANVGFIPWKDIVEIKEPTKLSHLFINVVVKNPQDYIKTQKSAFKRWMLKKNLSSNKDVLRISVNGLKCSSNELKTILDNKFTEYKTKAV